MLTEPQVSLRSTCGSWDELLSVNETALFLCVSSSALCFSMMFSTAAVRTLIKFTEAAYKDSGPAVPVAYRFAESVVPELAPSEALGYDSANNECPAATAADRECP